MSINIFASTSQCGTDLNWLWEDRPDELTAPGPLFQGSKGGFLRMPPRRGLEVLGLAEPLPRLPSRPSREPRVPKTARCQPTASKAAPRVCDLPLTSRSRSQQHEDRSCRIPEPPPVTGASRSQQNDQSCSFSADLCANSMSYSVQFGGAPSTQLMRSSQFRSSQLRPASLSRGPRRRQVVHRASRVTLAEASLSGPSASIWRGAGLSQALEEGQRNAAELARHKREAHEQCAMQGRVQASNWLWKQIRQAMRPKGDGHAARRPRIGNASEEDAECGGETRWDGPELHAHDDDERHSMHLPTQLSPHGGGGGGGEPAEDAGAAAALNMSSSFSSQAAAQAKPPKVQFTTNLSQESCGDEPDRDKFFKEGHSLEVMMLEAIPQGGAVGSRGVGSGADGDDGELLDEPRRGPPNKAVALTKSLSSMPKPLDLQSLASEDAEQDMLHDEDALHDSPRTSLGASSAPTKTPNRGKQRSHEVGRLRRLQRLMDARKAEFDSKDIPERDRLRRAFAKGDTSNRAFLDSHGLRSALADLGVKGQNRQEKDTINDVVKEASACGHVNFFDFVFQLVPRAELTLQEVRSPMLHAEFAVFDPMNSGFISQPACLEACKRHGTGDMDEETSTAFWKGFDNGFTDICKRFRHPDGRIDFSGFVELAKLVEAERAEFQHQSERRAAMLGNVSAALERRHFGEVAHLRRFWALYLADGESTLGHKRTLLALLDCGVLSPVGDPWDRCTRHLDGFEDLHQFRFTEFLNFVQEARDAELSALKDIVRAFLLNPKWSVPVARDDIPLLILDTGLLMDCVVDIPTIVETANKDGMEAFDIASLVELLGKVSQEARSKTRTRERKVMRTLHIRWNVGFALRTQFSTMTRNGVIGIEDIRAFLHNINPEVTASTSDIKALIEDVLEQGALGQVPSPTSSRAASSNALGAVMVSRSSAQGARAARMRELRATEMLNFEGYIILLGMIVD
mmetsp:Transcript_163136/g.523125  ORF Transcript_163136/g.523125 Transcript_163136/m.523125 type:complete len:968 (+) Transcript_163136:40-2943(+)|eukprot:CAMPEP_0203917918 /NCGR_PEP_ID=MMETSP0359-20131031/58483_1 /ASSEMBLY_ACC=CAM_ASM_000338 /TAXON_ID=268821 /ORGANISM="Scrippsiella Hangoei, Strain SHTV-5" /LENGTH=967 /DNA_ID=CAMNT_0050844909 /DNA_START=10 /DNA_END=2913 /DNA_ORIENTATION=-